MKLKTKPADPLMTETLSPAMQRALQQFRETPPPNPETWQAGRAAFLATAQQLASERVTFTPVARRKGWIGSPLRSLITSLKEARPMPLLLRFALVVMLLAGAATGTVTAAQGSLPGTLLYPVKTAWEDTQRTFSTAPESRLEQALTMAQERVNEMERLAEQDREIPLQVAERYERHLNAAMQAAGELPGLQQQQAHERIQAQLVRQEEVMRQVLARMQQDAGADTPVRQMAGILLRTRDRLQDPVGDPPQERPPDPPRTPHPAVTPAPAGPGGGNGEPGNGPGPNPTEPAPGPGEPGGGPGEPGSGPGPDPTEPAPGPGGPVEPGNGPGPGGPGSGPGPGSGSAEPTLTPGNTSGEGPGPGRS